MNDIIYRKLVIKSFHITEVIKSEHFEINHSTLKITTDIPVNDYIEHFNVSILWPNQDKDINGIMDILPISVKKLGQIGEGITHTLTGVYVMMTGADSAGDSYVNFGSSAGKLSHKLIRGRAGTPSHQDVIIHVDVCFKKGMQADRSAILSAHQTVNTWLGGLRSALLAMPAECYSEKHIFKDQKLGNKKRIAVVKMVGAQGAMHDRLILAKEPGGTEGAKSIVDLQGVPVILSPNEYRDGALRALT